MHANLLIRPIRENDLPDLLELAKASGPGFTTLPYNAEALANKIAASIQSFQRPNEALTSEHYLMVAEDLNTQKIVGTCGISTNIGSEDLVYSFKVMQRSTTHAPLNIRINHSLLMLTTDHQGSTELCTLFMLPEYRGGLNGQLLSRSRFLLMATARQRFGENIIAEMRGVSSEEGISPFFEAVGRYFFGPLKFTQADALTGAGQKQFVQDLMPNFPLYTCLLPESAQRVIGKVHEKTAPALKLLQREKFRYTQYVHIFDAGPTVETLMKNIPSIRRQRHAEVLHIQSHIDSPLYIICNSRLDFRACIGTLTEVKIGKVAIAPETAKALELQAGDRVRYLKVKDTL